MRWPWAKKMAVSDHKPSALYQLKDEFGEGITQLEMAASAGNFHPSFYRISVYWWPYADEEHETYVDADHAILVFGTGGSVDNAMSMLKTKLRLLQ